MSLSLDFLTRFINSFDGNKSELPSFIRKCDYAFNLASDSQKPILLAYVFSQITGKADSIINTREITTWEVLKNFLEENFSESKQFSQLLLELQSCKQHTNETILEFTQRIEQHYTNLLRSATNNTSVKEEIKGKHSLIKELALQAFLIGVHPR
ncbi:MAG: hypothetical protein ACRCTJ_00880 [Brevinema sp.]